ncbi:MAG: type II secretion system F family protein [Deltaproteobacteria bacterium]|nr:type II secretion system F family protein [Deltaproteobacteria bacterium]
MQKFAYKAYNINGTRVTGVIEADSRELASSQLTARGLIPDQIKPERSSTGLWAKLEKLLISVKPFELILFSKQLGTMIRAGIPIIRLFQILENQTESKALKPIVAEIMQDIQAGSSITESFRKHPRAFNNLYVSMLHAGEVGGTLPEVLDRLIYIIEHEFKIKRDIKAAMSYPIIVVIALIVAFFILLTFVVPKFVDIFVKAGIALPLPTKICMALYEAIFSYWPYGLAGLAALSVFLSFYLKTDHGRLMKDRLLLRIPLIGPLFLNSAMSRFASIFSILQGSGVPVLDIIRILSGTIGNYAIANIFDGLIEKLKEGRGISGPLSSAKYFPPMVVNMVAIGEESGNLEKMLSEVSTHYDTEVEYATAKLSAAIGPILMVGLAGVVGFFALAIYLPMWDLTQTVRH